MYHSPKREPDSPRPTDLAASILQVTVTQRNQSCPRRHHYSLQPASGAEKIWRSMGPGARSQTVPFSLRLLLKGWGRRGGLPPRPPDPAVFGSTSRKRRHARGGPAVQSAAFLARFLLLLCSMCNTLHMMPFFLPLFRGSCEGGQKKAS